MVIVLYTIFLIQKQDANEVVKIFDELLNDRDSYHEEANIDFESECEMLTV